MSIVYISFIHFCKTILDISKTQCWRSYKKVSVTMQVCVSSMWGPPHIASWIPSEGGFFLRAPHESSRTAFCFLLHISNLIFLVGIIGLRVTLAMHSSYSLFSCSYILPRERASILFWGRMEYPLIAFSLSKAYQSKTSKQTNKQTQCRLRPFMFRYMYE